MTPPIVLITLLAMLNNMTIEARERAISNITHGASILERVQILTVAARHDVLTRRLCESMAILLDKLKFRLAGTNGLKEEAGNLSLEKTPWTDVDYTIISDKTRLLGTKINHLYEVLVNRMVYMLVYSLVTEFGRGVHGLNQSAEDHFRSFWCMSCYKGILALKPLPNGSNQAEFGAEAILRILDHSNSKLCLEFFTVLTANSLASMAENIYHKLYPNHYSKHGNMRRGSPNVRMFNQYMNVPAHPFPFEEYLQRDPDPGRYKEPLIHSYIMCLSSCAKAVDQSGVIIGWAETEMRVHGCLMLIVLHYVDPATPTNERILQHIREEYKVSFGINARKYIDELQEAGWLWFNKDTTTYQERLDKAPKLWDCFPKTPLTQHRQLDDVTDR